MKPLVVKGWDGAEQHLSLAELLSQVTAFCGDFNTVEKLSTKRADLRKEAHRDLSRPIITSEAARLRKLSIETGRIHPKTGDLLPPMEPWTCPGHTAAIRLYADIMRAPDGTRKLGDVDTAEQLEHLAYMQEQQLITLGPGGTIHALGDVKSSSKEKYPGAPDPATAGIGRQLRERARGLILAAWLNITRGTPLNFVRRSSQLRSGGVAITTREICAEANVIKSRRPDLDEFRYLHIETCRRVVKELLGDGTLTELQPPKRVRANRTWHTLARVYELPPDSVQWPAATAAARSRRRPKRRKHTLRRAA